MTLNVAVVAATYLIFESPSHYILLRTKSVVGIFNKQCVVSLTNFFVYKFIISPSAVSWNVVSIGDTRLRLKVE